ncbi:MAG: hypothetical protein H7Y03_13090 [Chitinophagaceae bacterium]|nr:hypothetical protein [Chitinophagaceae bacterium]
MKKLTFNLSWALVLGMLLFSACKGDDGGVGPAGPAGAAGTPGPSGSAGPAGTANVTYSAWLDVTFDSLGFASIRAPKLTASILNQGDVKVYFNFNTSADPFIVPLPCSVTNGALPNIEITPFLSIDTIGLESNYLLSTATNPAGAKIRQFRYILIPGGTAARKANDVDWKNYEAVKAYLGLKD